MWKIFQKIYYPLYIIVLYDIVILSSWRYTQCRYYLLVFWQDGDTIRLMTELRAFERILMASWEYLWCKISIGYLKMKFKCWCPTCEMWNFVATGPQPLCDVSLFVLFVLYAIDWANKHIKMTMHTCHCIFENLYVCVCVNECMHTLNFLDQCTNLVAHNLPRKTWVENPELMVTW